MKNLTTGILQITSRKLFWVKFTSLPELVRAGRITQPEHPQRQNLTPVLCQGGEDLGDTSGCNTQVCSPGPVRVLASPAWWSCGVPRTPWFLGVQPPGLGAWGWLKHGAACRGSSGGAPPLFCSGAIQAKVSGRQISFAKCLVPHQRVNTQCFHIKFSIEKVQQPFKR